MPSIITVSNDPYSDAQFHSLSKAIASIPTGSDNPVTIQIAPGIYHEKVRLERPFVTLLGMGTDSADTVISYDDYANDLMPDGEKRGTFRSYTLLVHAHDVTLRHLTVENASGDSKTHGQAIALYAEGDRILVDDCRLLGRQDTLFTGPLPPKELQPNGFIGPTQNAPRVNGRQCYKNCYICGDVDFIFGSATAYFYQCTIESLRRDLESENSIQGYVTAASTPEGQEYGYVLCECTLTTDCCPDGTVYLGRPWRNYAKTVYLRCVLGQHIHPAGFHDWNKTDAHETFFYAEYENTVVGNGVGSSQYQSNANNPNHYEDKISTGEKRADFVQALTDDEAAMYTMERVLGGDDGWNLN